MQPRICSHRGEKYQENTAKALKHAKIDGADMIEFDAQRTKDGVWILHHDLYLFDEEELIKDLRYDTIIERAEAEGVQIDTLDHFLNEVSGIEMNFECKSNGFEDGQEFAKFLNDYTIRDPYNVSSFYADTIKGLFDQDPNLRLSYLGYILPWIKWRYLHWRVPLFSINPLYRFTSKRRVKQAHGYGLELHTWVANTEEEITNCLEDGVDVIITDELQKALKLRSDYFSK